MWKATKSLKYKIRRLWVDSSIIVYLNDKYTMFHRTIDVKFEKQFSDVYWFIVFYEKNKKIIKPMLRFSDLYWDDDGELFFKFQLEVTLTDEEVEDIVKKVKQQEKQILKDKEQLFEKLKKELWK